MSFKNMSAERIQRIQMKQMEPSSSEEPSSFDEPSSSDESSNESSNSNDLANKILWVSNTAWYSWTDELGYPRPQGNIPMLVSGLRPYKQKSLLNAYLDVHANSVQ
jgi:hypothetical protein